MSGLVRSITNPSIERRDVKDLETNPNSNVNVNANTNATKTEVIGIAIAATVVLLLLSIAGAWLFLRWRRRRRPGNTRGGDTDSLNGDGGPLHETASKVPLIGQHNLSRATESPVPPYDDLVPIGLQRNRSTSTVESLPPAYSSTLQASSSLDSQDMTSQIPLMSRSHRSMSSLGGSDGLRPLMLVEAQNSHNESPVIRADNHSNRSSQTNSPNTLKGPDTLSLQTSRPTGRPRAASRFREEDLDT